MNSKKIIIGIDATNLRQGGGRTHLIELLHAVNLEKHGVKKIILWGGTETLAMINNKSWLKKITPPALNKGLASRMLWQRFQLSKAVRNENCDILLVPGGSYSGDFAPYVTMSQNMLPFEMKELFRHGISILSLKFIALRLVQQRTLKNSNGIIFLSNYAQKVILGKFQYSNKTIVIPHGINLCFQKKPKTHKKESYYNKLNPFKLLYVSRISPYKHQWNVVEAVSIVRSEGFHISLDLVGSALPYKSLKKLQKAINKFDSAKQWVNLFDEVPYSELHSIYAGADLAVFASSCENMPNILLEKMSAGLPIACSNKGPMPEVLGKRSVYFDPENPTEIARIIKMLLCDSTLRQKEAESNFRQSKNYSWELCADTTFNFLKEITLST